MCNDATVNLKSPLFSIATVVYAAELPLLRLQARSLARHGDPQSIHQILICVNDRNEERVLREVEKIVPLYGRLADCVSILGSKELFNWSGMRSHLDVWSYVISRPRLSPLLRIRKLGWGGYHGWRMQQAFKLAIARKIKAQYAIILDAKNIFVERFRYENFVAPTGRPLTTFHPLTEKSERWFDASRQALGIRDQQLPELVTRFITPYCVTLRTLEHTLSCLETVSGPVQCVFANRNPEPTEFMLINAWAHHFGGGIERVFEDGFAGFENLSLSSPTAALESALRNIEDGISFGISPHAGLVGRLDNSSLSELIVALRNSEVADEAVIASEFRELIHLNEHRVKRAKRRLNSQNTSISE